MSHTPPRSSPARSCKNLEQELRNILDLAVRAHCRSEFRALATELLGRVVFFDIARFSAPVAPTSPRATRVALGEDTRSISVHLESGGFAVTRLELERTGPGAPFTRQDLDAIRFFYAALALGESVFGRAERTQTFDVVPGEAFCALTAREREVVVLLVQGFENGEIAHALGSSVNTVRNQLAAIYRKSGAGSRTELVRRALECGLGLNSPFSGRREG